MRKLIIHIFYNIPLILSFQTRLPAQNIVPDPGFELVTRFYDGKDTVFTYKYWKSLLYSKQPSPDGIPIFSVYSKRKPYDRFLNFWVPYEGDSYMFSYYVYLRNLFQTTLIEEMERGQVYKINFKYKVLAHGFSKQKREDSINDKIGVMFTSKDMSDSTGIAAIKNMKKVLRPQISIQSFLADSISTWQDFTYYFKADKVYQFLIIGNFQKLIESYELKNVPLTGISYRIDNVSVERVVEDEYIKELLHNQNTGRN